MDICVTPTPLDMLMGLILIGLILAAIRRMAGGVLAAIVFGFLVYAYAGRHLSMMAENDGFV